MAKSANEYRELLLAGRWFASLPAGFQGALLAAAEVRPVTEGQVLFHRGAPCDGLYAVLDGVIRVTGGETGNKEAVLALVESPQWFGEIAVFDGLARTHDAIAMTEGRVVRIPTAALNAMLAAHPAWWRDLALLVTAKLRLAFVMLEDTALLPLAPRVARRLVLMAEGYGEFSDRSRRVVKVRQDLLAAMVNASRQSTNAVLKQLESDRLITVAYGEVEILDLEGLRRRS